MCVCTYVHMYVCKYAGAPVVAGGQLLGFVSLLLPRRPQRSNSHQLGDKHLQADIDSC